MMLQRCKFLIVEGRVRYILNPVTDRGVPRCAVARRLHEEFRSERLAS